MKIVKNSLTLSLLALLALGGFSTLSAKEQPQKGNNKPLKAWYMSTRVTVSDPADNGKIHKGTNPAIFGRMAGSNNGKDTDDVGTYGSVVKRPAAVVFVHSDWGGKSGEYHSNYYGINGQTGSWEMTVFSSVNDGKVTLEWDGLFALTPTESGKYDEQKVLDSRTLEDLKLIDTETSEVIEAVTDGKLNTHSFTMGEEGFRTFLWVQGPVNASHFAPEKGTQRYINLSKRRARAKSVSAQDKQGHKGIGPPPF